MVGPSTEKKGEWFPYVVAFAGDQKRRYKATELVIVTGAPTTQVKELHNGKHKTDPA